MTAVVMLVIAGALVAVCVHDLIRRPVLRRQAMRNLVRRPAETSLMVAGALLGTAIITASFVVGDTVASTIRDVARTNLGPIDEVLTTEDPVVADQAWAALSEQLPGEVDGVVRATGLRIATSHGQQTQRLADPSVWAFEIDFDSARQFAGSDDSGLAEAGATPGAGQVTISEPLARTLDAHEGDRIDIYAYGEKLEMEVSAVTPRVGLGGRGTDNVHLPPGTLDDLYQRAVATNEGATAPTRYIYISNTGGVIDGADLTQPVIEWAQGRLDEAGISASDYELGDWKAELLAEADAEGADFTTIFSSIGAFAVISGILLVINIVTMLTDERRSQLGILRALGLRRGQVVRLMALEGTAHAIASTLLGLIAGVGVGWVVAGLTGRVFEQDRLNLAFTVNGSSLLLAGAIGLVLTLSAVWIASIRLARMNVIAAIRDLPAPPSARRRTLTMAGGLGLALLGGALLFVATSADNPIAALVSVPMAVAGVGIVSAGLIRPRVAASAAGAASIAWGIAVFSVLPRAMDNPEISVFVFQGVVLVSGAVALSIANQALWERLLGRFGTGRRGVALRLGLAYPLARPARNALLLAMFSLVIFTITFMAVLVAVFDSEGDSIADQTAAGFDIVIEANPNSPTSAADLLGIADVEVVAPLDRRRFDVEGPFGETSRPVTAVDERYVSFGGADMSGFADAYDDPAQVWQDVLSQPGLVVVDEYLFGDTAVRPGTTITVIDVDGAPLELEVAGVLRADWLWNAIYTSGDTMALLDSTASAPSRYFVSAAAGADADELAARISGALLVDGAEARSVQSIIEEELSQQNSFIRILQGYLGLGLLIGVAGLGIVLVRAVRERRREIGTLRAIGYPAQTVRSAFLVEATFVSLQGAVMGVLLGILTAWQVVSNVDAFAAGSMDFVVPVALVMLIAIGPVVASLAAAAFPARRAASIAPAVALRITG
ncbi:MAG: FtsX-like permease family protein [Acidimicrobiales bacterium]